MPVPFRFCTFAAFAITLLAFAAPVSAQTLMQADRYFAEGSYALAADAYAKLPPAVRQTGAVRLHFAQSLGRAGHYDEAIAATNALVADRTLMPIFQIKVLAWKGDLFSLLPATRWRVGDETIVWGSERPAVPANGDAPVREDYRAIKSQIAFAAREAALLRLSTLAPQTRQTLVDIEAAICQKLYAPLYRDMSRWYADIEQKKATVTADAGGAIVTTEPYPVDAPAIRRFFWTLTRRAELATGKPDDYLQAVLARALALRELRQQSRTEGGAGLVKLTYGREDADALILAAVQKYPAAKNAPDALEELARRAGLSERGKRLYAELARRFPAYAAQGGVKQSLDNFDLAYVTIGAKSPVVPTFEPVRVYVSTKNLKAVNYALYRLDPRKALFDPSRWQKPEQSVSDAYQIIGGWSNIAALGEPLKTWREPVKTNSSEIYAPVDHEANVHVPRDEAGKSIPGLYLLTATGSNGNYFAAGIVPVSGVSLVWKKVGKEGCLIYAADADGVPLRDVRLSLKWTRSQSVRQKNGEYKTVYATRFTTGVTGADGVSSTTIPYLAGDYGTNLQSVAQVGDTDRFAVLNSTTYDGYRYRYESSDSVATSVVTYTYTERPLYRPKQTVHFRVLRAKPTGATSYAPQVGEAVMVRVVASGDKEIYKGTVTTSQFGTASGSFALPPDAPLGDYLLDITPAKPEKKDANRYEARSGTSFRVEEYRRPEFSVVLSTNRKTVRAGETVTATATATRFDGSPVSGGTVKVRVERHSYEEYGGDTQVVREETLPTDATGTVKLSFVATATKEAKPGYEDIRYSVFVSTTDGANREATDYAQIAQTKTGYVAKISPDANFGVVGEPTRLAVTVFGNDSQPAKLTGTIVVRHLTLTPDGKTERGTPRYRPSPESPTVATVATTTNESGNAAATFTPTEPGYYEATFSATDGRGETVSTQTTFPVGGSSNDFDLALTRYNDVHYAASGGAWLIAERSGNYAPGDTARFLLVCPQPQTILLQTVESDAVLGTSRVATTGYSAVVSVPVRREFAPNVTVAVAGVKNGASVSAFSDLRVPATWNVAKLTVTPGKSEYKPGETGTFILRATDADNKPVQAEVSLGAVDASLLALQADETPDIGTFFYTGRSRDISLFLRGSDSTAFQPFSGEKTATGEITRTARMLQVGAAGVGMGAMVGRSGVSSAQVRRDFRETGVWFPAVLTDSDTGTATVTATFPESLTSWKVTARGITENVLVGAGDAEFVTRKNLAVRLATPRFLVERDAATFTATVRNDLATAQTVRVRLEGEGVVRGADASGTFPAQTLTVPANAEATATFAATAPKGSGTQTLRVFAEAEGESDAMETTLPILPYGVQKFVTQTGTLNGDSGAVTLRFAVPKERTADGSALIVQIAPGPIGAILDTLPYLADYPYGCAEQTMSRFLPSVLVARTLQASGVPLDTLRKRADALRRERNTERGFGKAVNAPADPIGYTYPAGTPNTLRLQTPNFGEDLPHGDRWNNPVFDAATLNKMTREGYDRLMTFRKGDGGFGWWAESRASDPYMTAYILYGLAEMKGAKVAPEGVGAVLTEGGAYLAAHVADAAPNDAAWQLFALTYCDKKLPASAAKSLAALYTGRDKLSPYGLSLLALTLHRTGDAAKAQTVCRNLRNFVQVDAAKNTARIVVASGRGWGWYDNANEANAWALRALLAVEPNGKLLPQLAEGLVQSRRGGYWRSTKETAFVVYALAEYFAKTKDAAPDMSVTIALSGGVKRTYRITPENALLFDNMFAVPGSLLTSGDQTVTITKTGKGRLDFGGAVQFTTTKEQIKGAGSEVAVNRRYKRTDGSEVKDGDALKPGERVTVELTVTAQNDHRYVVVEDRKPAGCEPSNLRSGFAWGEDLWATTEVRDTKTAFFLESLPRGTYTLRYELRAETHGTFHALPVNALAMYAPEVRAISDSATVTLSP